MDKGTQDFGPFISVGINSDLFADGKKLCILDKLSHVVCQKFTGGRYFVLPVSGRKGDTKRCFSHSWRNIQQKKSRMRGKRNPNILKMLT